MAASIPPGSTIGILGGGQLGMMMAQAATKMGYHTHIYCPDPDSPAFAVSKFKTVAAYDDAKALKNFARSVHVVTYEFENIPANPVFELSRFVTVRPDPQVLAVSQHRVLEKTTINQLGISTAPFAPVTSTQELTEALKTLGFPAVLKTALMGYDGKGQWKIKSEADIPQLQPSQLYVLEGFVDFRMEISVIVARDVEGYSVCYVPVQNIHKNHILSETIVPAPIPKALADEAEAMARTIADGLKLVGLMAVEMFVTQDDKLLVNELAPRPHNSGHWTIDACTTSQFEQTIRAVCGLSLQPIERTHNARMLNLIGDEVNDAPLHSKDARARVHLYGKKETRPGRKMGHVTFLEPRS